MRAGIEGKIIKLPENLLSDEPIAVTVSIGGAWFREQETPEAFVDRALYLSKEHGRNQVTWESQNTGN